MSFKPKILLVDDNEVLRKLCYDYLVPEGYTLFEASNGRAAVETALRELPQVIILDIIMPVMDGLETCRILRGEEKLRNTCIMFLSTRDEVPDRVRGLDTGADEYLGKPFDHKELVARVRALMRIARLQYELDESNRKLYQLSITDYLTGLSNMRHFYSEAEKMFLRAGKKNGSMSVIMFDLDRFKNVVDTNGHPFGSKVLADIGGLMRSLIHGPDNILSRYGGDEFMIALEDAGEKKAEEVSGLLQRKLNSAVFEFEGKKVRGISASFGVAVYKNGEHRDLQDMIRDADAAMFQAKENGRGLIRVRV